MKEITTKVFLSMFVTVVGLLIQLSAHSQILSDNMLKNSGGEDGTTNHWDVLEGGMKINTSSHSGKFSFKMDGWSDKIEQKVDVSTFSQHIINGSELLLSSWMQLYWGWEQIATVTFQIRFFDNIGFEISNWDSSVKSLDVSHGTWKEFIFRTEIPKNTRSIAVTISKDNIGRGYLPTTLLLDDMFVKLFYNEPTPTPTVTQIPVLAENNIIYNFSEPTASSNDLLIFPPGAIGEFDLCDVSFRPLTVDDEDKDYTDGFGIIVVTHPGEGATFYGKPITVGDDYVFLRISAWTSGVNISLAVGALDAEEAKTIADADLNGSIGSNILLNCSRFVDNFGYLEALYKSERGTIVPIFQVANFSNNEQIKVQLDNLKIYKISKVLD